MVRTPLWQADDGALLLAIVDEAYNRRTLSDTNVRKSLRGITAAEAAWRPAHARHNVFAGARYGWKMMGGKLVDLLARIP